MPDPLLMDLLPPAAPDTFSGVPSLGGVGGKEKDEDVAWDVEGCTDKGAEGEGWLGDLLLKEAAAIQPEEAREVAVGCSASGAVGEGWLRERLEKWEAAACIQPEWACGTMDLPDSAAIQECSGEWKWGRHIWDALDPATPQNLTENTVETMSQLTEPRENTQQHHRT